jgi:acyl phosphate:glycerol-3-phosphate acyltransferase
MPALVWIAVSYLVGAIPAAFIAGKWRRRVDRRDFGSGNLGATNVYRVLGLRAALGVLAFDIAKGAVPVLLFPRWTSGAPSGLWPIAYGVAAILGHIRPVYLGGRGGGKGVATATGVLGALAPMPMVVGVAVWSTVLVLTRYVSLASVCAAFALPAGIGIWYGPASPLFAGSAIIGAFVIWTHRANLRRLAHGTEPRIGAARGA